MATPTTEQLPSDEFSPGDPVTYRYGSRKVHATVVELSTSRKRVKIKYQRPGCSFYERVYVMPKNLERGHV